MNLHRASLILIASTSIYLATSCDAFWAAAPAALSTASTIAQAIARERGEPLTAREADALERALEDLAAARKSLDEAERNADERCRETTPRAPVGVAVQPAVVVPRARRKARVYADVAGAEAKLADVVARLARIESALDAGAD